MEKLKSNKLRRFPHSDVFYGNDMILLNKINELVDFANEVEAGIKAASLRVKSKETESEAKETKIEPENGNGRDIAPEIGSS